MLATHVWQQGIFARAPENEPPRVGFPRFFDQNVFAPGAAPPTFKQSYLARVTRSLVPEDQRFGLADHISVPVTQLEAQFTSALSTSVQGLFSRTRSLKAAANTLVSSTPSGVFERRAAGSTDSGVTAVAADGAALGTYNVDVVQLARAQQNVGEQLLAGQSPSRFVPGTHTFDVTVAGVATPVTVTIAPGDSNLQALTRVRDAVNAASTPVEASIAITGDVAQLVLTARQTGTQYGFTVSDVAGDIVSTSGANLVALTATDAIVRLGGVEQTLQENRLSLDPPANGASGRVTLYFHDVTEAAAHIDVTVALDAHEVFAATDRLVRAVNDLHAFLEDKPHMLSQGLLSRLDVAVDDLQQSLASIGIARQSNRLLEFDSARLRQQIDQRPNDVQQVLGGPAGLAARERSVAETVLSNTAVAFATKPGPLGSEYGRSLVETARLHNYLYGGLFVNVRL